MAATYYKSHNYRSHQFFDDALCNDFIGKNKQALSSHKRGCKNKHEIQVDTTSRVFNIITQLNI